TTWAPGSYFLGSENPQANGTWGLNRAELAAPVAPGGIVTVGFDITSPAAVGNYNFQWRMVHNSARFGSLTENASIAVSAADGAAFVSQSVPEAMAPGQSYPVSVTLRNTGGTTWAVGTYYLGSENPEANGTWGLNRVDLGVPVGPGAYATLAFNVTAPSTPGVYNFQWRMVNNATRFGAFTTNFPVDVQAGQAQTLYFVHADHLNTPRLVANQSGQTVWRWDQDEPFGNNSANEDPDANSVAFDLPLRLPGQRYDAETGLHYNYFRDYDPSVGRYGESDPIGLLGGLNTYAYVDSSPLRNVDPDGLVKWSGTAYTFSAISLIGASFSEVDLWSECACGKRYHILLHGVGPAVGLGLKVVATISDISFDDGQSCPSPGAFAGTFLGASAGATVGALPVKGRPSPMGLGFPGIGVGAGISRHGKATSDFNPSAPGGAVVGRDLSISGVWGSSTVSVLEVKDCCK
ncbi:MAG: RHS repeat-associated core domain-containing protein, partial [bacterium]